MVKGQPLLQIPSPPLPPPHPAKAGSGKLRIVTLGVLALLAAAVFWLTRDDETRTVLKKDAISKVDEAVQGTPLSAVSKYLTPPPPPPPPSVVAPATPPGTLSGQVIQSTVPTNVDTTGEPVPAAPEAAAPAKVEEDSAVRLSFVEDLAHWMVQRYQPGKGPQWGVSGVNMRYGMHMYGLNPRGADNVAGRSWLLRYAFNPAMLNALYSLYADRFVEELGLAAAEPRRGQPLTAEHTDAMYQAYADRFVSLGGALQGIAALTDFQARMAGLSTLNQQSINIYTKISEAVFALDEVRETGNSTRIETAQLRVNGLNAQYQKMLGERNTAQQNLLAAIRQGGPAARTLDDDTIMFIAAWMERRASKDAQASQAAVTAAGLLDNLAERLRKAASIAR